MDSFGTGFEKRAKIYKNMYEALGRSSSRSAEPMRIISGAEFMAKIQHVIAEREAMREVKRLKDTKSFRLPLPSVC